MDGKIYTKKPKNPREGANPISVLTFGYILRLFWVGYRRDLDIQDLYEPLKEHNSSRLGEKISKLWEEECQRVNKKQQSKRKGGGRGKDKDDLPKVQPSLLRVLMKCFGAKLMLYGVLLAVMEILLRLLQPLFLSLLISHFRVGDYYPPIHTRILPVPMNGSLTLPDDDQEYAIRSLSVATESPTSPAIDTSRK